MQKNDPSKVYDVLIIGSGVSGSVMAYELTKAGMSCLVLEAGEFFSRSNFPSKEIDSNSKLYWSGGAEFNTSASIALLRPKVVGGGSIVNQALLDRFDDDALESFQRSSGVSYFNSGDMNDWYSRAESGVKQEIIPELARNKNAEVFQKGFEANGYKCSPLNRAQSNCHFEKGNDCIECLGGCRADSKQSMLITYLKDALQLGLNIKSLFEVLQIEEKPDLIRVHGIYNKKEHQSFKAKKLVMASGAIGNSKLLLASGYNKQLPALGEKFYTHPQFMVLGLFKEEMNSHKGAFQAFKSSDPSFRKKGFKLENVFAPPVALSMLIKGHGRDHMNLMKKISHMGCIEVAIRDTNPGKIKLKNNKLFIEKFLNAEDCARRDAGIEAIHNIFESQKVEKIIQGNLPIGLHLMGGCSIGTNGRDSVVSPDFNLHGSKRIFIADSSIFPDAPGINPSLTIMALSKKASKKVVKA